MKKFLSITGGIILLLLISISIFIYFSGPELPPDTDEIIEQVMEDDLPEQIKGRTGFAENDSVKIWYESIDPPGSVKGTILIIMGITNDAFAWPGYFIEPLVEAGYRVVRYDHRGTGMSDWLDDWNEDNPYNLDDMSDDGFAILDELEVRSVHIIGVSMGGMIAQNMAINHPERILSLTSIMSSGYIEDPELPSINMSTLYDLALIGIKYLLIGGEANLIKMSLSARLILRAGYDTDIDVKDDAERMLYNLRKRKGLNYNVTPQHLKAVSVSGSRYEDLKKLNVPALVIHGKADPLIPFAHGQKCAELIPNADSLWIKEMGHDLSPRISGIIVETILDKYSSL